MAGMLPGVECARRRRFHQSGGLSDSAGSRSRRPSFCLYTSSHESHHVSASTLQQRSLLNQVNQDEKLGGLAREAKERLDERLRSQRNSDSKRHNGKKALRLLTMEEKSSVHLAGEMQLQIEVFGPKKKKKFSWYKLSYKASEEEEECAVCLERYKAGETLVHLPCTHRFHVKCLVPWLETNTHCPCCRMAIVITQ